MASSSTSEVQVQEVTPTLNGLPKELKILIVEAIAEIDFEEDFEDEDDEDDSEEEEHDCSTHAPGDHGHSHGKHSHEEHEHDGNGCCGNDEMPAMIAISLVNRAFAELAYPYLYKAIELDDCSNVDLASFVNNVLPRQGVHVEMISINLEEFSDYSVSPEEGGTEVQEAETLKALDAVVETVVVTEKKESDRGQDYSIRQRHNLVSHIIGLLPNLNTVTFTMNPNPLTGEGEKAVLALQAVGEKIIDLTLEGSGESFNSAYLSQFLASFPNVLRLDIDFGSMDRTGESALIETIASLEKVTNLSLWSAEFVNEELASIAWKSPIKTLTLSECENLNFPSFVKLITQFSSTLKHLELDDVPHNSIDVDNKKHLGVALPLPVLETLCLGTQHPASFLQCFSSCPIKELEICFCPSITSSQWEQFIISKASTLKTLRIQNDSNFSEAEIESMELFCLVKGIECEIEPEDSDDEDDEDGDEMYGEDDWEEEDEDEEEEDGDGFSDEEEV